MKCARARRRAIKLKACMRLLCSSLVCVTPLRLSVHNEEIIIADAMPDDDAAAAAAYVNDGSGRKCRRGNY